MKYIKERLGKLGPSQLRWQRLFKIGSDSH